MHKNRDAMLFDQETAFLANQAGLWALAEEVYPHEKIEESRYVVVKAAFAPYAFLLGNPTEEDLRRITQWLMAHDKISLVCNERFHRYFIQQGLYVQPRVQLSFNPKNIPNKVPLPNGYSVEKIKTKELFSKCAWFEFITSLYGTAEQFLNHGFGYVLIKEDGLPVAEVYACYIAHSLCEVGVITHPDFRGKGYSTLLVPYLLDECLQRNLTPVWNCDVNNSASLKVALKAGFDVDKYYAFLKK